MIKNSVLIYLLILFFHHTEHCFSQCVSSGAKNPSVFINDVSIGTIAWSTPSNVAVSDNNRSTAGALIVLLSTTNTNYLQESDFGFSIPATASICGIKVEIEKQQQGVLIGSSVKDNSVKILKGGVVCGNEHASGANWSGSDAYATYGGSADLWGVVWAPADINAANFGVALSAGLNAGLASLFLSAEIDHIRMTVYYDNILPIELIDFSASCSDKSVQLKWTTASQINNDYFTIESSIDGINFRHVGLVNGAGNTNQMMSYSLTDDEPYNGISYYRLKQTDFNGLYEYFKLVSVQCDPDSEKNIFPNPSSGKFTLEAKGKLTIYNLNGEEIYFEENMLDTKQIDLSEQSKGIYFYQLKSSNEIMTSGKIIIE
jgi:hypothetical protein